MKCQICDYEFQSDNEIYYLENEYGDEMRLCQGCDEDYFKNLPDFLDASLDAEQYRRDMYLRGEFTS